MYRNKNKPPLAPHDTQFWRYAAKLKKCGYKSIIHALADSHFDLYKRLISELRSETPIERITILLWRDYHTQLSQFEKLGFGTLAPTSIRRFRDKYFKPGNFADPAKLRKKKEDEIVSLSFQVRLMEKQVKRMTDIELRVMPTATGMKFRKEYSDLLFRIVRLQSQLS